MSFIFKACATHYLIFRFSLWRHWSGSSTPHQTLCIVCNTLGKNDQMDLYSFDHTIIRAYLIPHSLRELSHHTVSPSTATRAEEGKDAAPCQGAPAGETAWARPHLCPHRRLTLQGTPRSPGYSASHTCLSPHPLYRSLWEPLRRSNMLHRIHGWLASRWRAVDLDEAAAHTKSAWEEKAFLT